MAITFDKKSFRRSYRDLKRGKSKFHIRQSFYQALGFAFLMTVFNYFFDDKIFPELLLKFIFYFVFMFVCYYFISKFQWKQIKDDYNDTLDYWEKHDPAFFEGEKYEKFE
jgi:hypothetical protein